ncbi:MAG: CapA family protein [Clostridia bacterium]|nr:CapA family protein [Clostridia bacterium]
MKIIIAGDLVPTKSNEELFKDKDFFKKLDTEFQNIWNSADYRIFNLECPLGVNLTAIDKNGAKLLATSSTIEGIKSLNPNLVLLANNHILDYDIEGLDSTINLLNKYDIQYTGVIDNTKTKNDTYFIQAENKKIGIYNLCENEFSVATNNSKGANPLDEIKNYKEIKEAKDSCDYLVVVFHGGKEFYRYPSPNLQRICRNFVDFGADLVITQHSHCIGCKEEYNKGTIIYGQGNFIFDCGINDEYWKTSLLITLDINSDIEKIDYIPIEKENNLIKISNDSKIIEDFLARTDEIKDNEKFIKDEYNKFSRQHLNNYLNIMNKRRFYKRILNRLFNREYFVKTYKKEDCLNILNIIECEAHRELLITGLKERIKGTKHES